MKMTTMVLACDLSRFAVLQMSQAGSYLKYPFLDINYQNHDVSHEDNGGTPNARPNYTQPSADPNRRPDAAPMSLRASAASSSAPVPRARQDGCAEGRAVMGAAQRRGPSGPSSTGC